ncbi:MAG: isocitrate lyase [Nitrososphaerales archaeon]
MKNIEIDEINAYFESERWDGIRRPYTAEDVYKLRGSVRIEYSIAKQTSEKLWKLLNIEPFVPTLGAITGNQAVQMVQAGLKAIYLSGWQVAADGNLAGKMYPDQSLYPSNSVPTVVKRINQSLLRADQIQHIESLSGENKTIDWLAPIIADGEAGFGGPLNVFELTKEMIEAGAAGVHYEDQLSSEKKCGHLGGKVLVPTNQFVRSLISARLASDVMGVPILIVARTDANAAQLITSDIDPVDQKFLTGERTPEGFFRVKDGIESAIARGISYAPYCDMIWCETSTPNIEEARRFADAIHAKYPKKLLAYNCSPSFHWEKKLGKEEIRTFQKELSQLGYKFQFITLAGFHLLNYSMFELASEYAMEGMPAYVKLQRKEFEATELGYEGVKHQRFVGTGYFDEVSQIVQGGVSSTVAMKGSTEEEQFEKPQEIKESA